MDKGDSMEVRSDRVAEWGTEEERDVIAGIWCLSFDQVEEKEMYFSIRSLLEGIWYGVIHLRSRMIWIKVMRSLSHLKFRT